MEPSSRAISPRHEWQSLSKACSGCPNRAWPNVILVAANLVRLLPMEETLNEIYADGLCERIWLAHNDESRAGARNCGLHGVRGSIDKGGRPPGQQPPSAKLDGGDRAGCKRQIPSIGWPLRGIERAVGWLLSHRCCRSRCCTILGGPLPGRRSRRRRGARHLEHVRMIRAAA